MRIIKDGKIILRKDDKHLGAWSVVPATRPQYLMENTMSAKNKVGKRKSKRTRKQPKCTLCNPFRWMGNTKGRHRHSYYRQQQAA